MISKRHLREKPSIDWKTLHFGEKLPRINCKITRKVLNETYEVERIIHRKHSSGEGYSYLIKWKDYPSYESTWEPEDHIPRNIRDSYFFPLVSEDRISSFSAGFEKSVQKRLKSRSDNTVVDCDLDVFRSLFGSDKELQLYKKDFQKLKLSIKWDYTIDVHGEGIQLCFPVFIKPKLRMKKEFLFNDGKSVPVYIPTETLLIKSKTEVFNRKNPSSPEKQFQFMCQHHH